MFAKRQPGQALAEYQALIPIGILLALLAGAISGFLITSFEKTADGLQPEAECQDQSGEEDNAEGPRTATLGTHRVELVSQVYNGSTNTTTVVYRVTSSGDPSISHWTLGVPANVASKVVRASEAYEVGTDPTTGVFGVKFDRGYESGNDGGGGKPKPKTSAVEGYMLAGYSPRTSAVETRDIMIVLSGEFDWSGVTVAVKAGTQTNTNTLSAPVSEKQPEEQCEGE
jgi:hypothetical protein